MNISVGQGPGELVRDSNKKGTQKSGVISIKH